MPDGRAEVWLQTATMPVMAVNLHVRDLPDDLHETLVRRSGAAGMSLRQYVVSVLAEHVALPTVDEWLADVAAAPRTRLGMSGAQAVRQAREADDDELARARAGR